MPRHCIKSARLIPAAATRMRTSPGVSAGGVSSLGTKRNERPGASMAIAFKDVASAFVDARVENAVAGRLGLIRLRVIEGEVEASALLSEEGATND